MNLEESIIQSIQKSTEEVFSTMLGVELKPGRSSIENRALEANDGLVSFIGFAGSWVGTGSLTCSPAMACRICSHMLLCESVAVNEEVLDTLAELTNIIIGGVKTDLEGQLGPLGLSIPTVVFGKNFRTRSAGTTEWIVTRFDWEGDTLAVKMCLSPSDRAAHTSPSLAGHACTLIP